MLVYQRVGPTVQDRQGRFAIQPTVSWGRLSFILTCQWCEIWWICCRMRTAMASWPGRGSDGSESASRKWNKASTWSHAPTWSHLWELMIFDISDIDLSCPSIQGQQSLKKYADYFEGSLEFLSSIPTLKHHFDMFLTYHLEVYMAYLFWHSIWHSFWDILWHSILSDSLTLYLASILTYFLACILTFFLACIHILSGILSGIYSDIFSVMYSGILSGIYSDMSFGIPRWFQIPFYKSVLLKWMLSVGLRFINGLNTFWLILTHLFNWGSRLSTTRHHPKWTSGLPSGGGLLHRCQFHWGLIWLCNAWFAEKIGDIREATCNLDT